MELPEHIKLLTEQALQTMRNDSKHRLSLETRLAIYQSFGPSTVRKEESTQWKLYGFRSAYYIPISFSLADNVFNWLAVLTAKKVISAWLNSEHLITDNDEKSLNPERMLE